MNNYVIYGIYAFVQAIFTARLMAIQGKLAKNELFGNTLLIVAYMIAAPILTACFAYHYIAKAVKFLVFYKIKD